MPKELSEITEEWLKANGYDGLFSRGECACVLDDLMPCGEPQPDCEAGYQGAADPETGYDFVIGPDKPKEVSGD